MSQAPIIALKPIPIKDRVSMIFVYYVRIDVRDGAFVVIRVPHPCGDEPSATRNMPDLPNSCALLSRRPNAENPRIIFCANP